MAAERPACADWVAEAIRHGPCLEFFTLNGAEAGVWLPPVSHERGVTRLGLGASTEARRLYKSLGFTASTAEMTVPFR